MRSSPLGRDRAAQARPLSSPLGHVRAAHARPPGVPSRACSRRRGAAPVVPPRTCSRRPCARPIVHLGRTRGAHAHERGSSVPARSPNAAAAGWNRARDRRVRRIRASRLVLASFSPTSSAPSSTLLPPFHAPSPSDASPRHGSKARAGSGRVFGAPGACLAPSARLVLTTSTQVYGHGRSCPCPCPWMPPPPTRLGRPHSRPRTRPSCTPTRPAVRLSSVYAARSCGG